MKHIKLFEELTIEENEFPEHGYGLSPREKKIYLMIKKFENFEYNGDVLSDHIQMTQKMIDHLKSTLSKYVSDMWLVTFVESDDDYYNYGYKIHHHYNKSLPKEKNGLFFDYEMCIKLGSEEILKVKISIIAWLCEDNMVKYVKLIPNELEDSALHDDILDPLPDELFYVTLENFIESVKAGLILEKIIFT